VSASSAEVVGVGVSDPASGSGLTSGRLAWVQATSRRRWALSLWLCLSVAFAVPALLPLTEVIAAESALADTLAHHGSFTVQQDVTGVDAFSAFDSNVDATVNAQMGPNLVRLASAATVGPFSPITLNGQPAPLATTRQGLAPTYLDHLAAHVSVAAGELPPEGLGGGDTAVTMPQAGSDQLGLHLSDRFCLRLSSADQQPRWCARLVGLWQPIDPRDPYWGGSPPRMLLTMGRYDFFQLMKLQPPVKAAASLRYEANPTQIDTRNATTVSGQVRQLSDQLRGSGLLVVTALDRSLDAVAASQRATSFMTRLVAAAVALLGLLVVALVSARFLDGQAHDLGVLRARGWSRGRTWRLAFASPATVALLALPAGLAGCVAIAVGLSVTPSRISVLPLRLWDLPGPAAAVAASAAGLVAVLALSAARAVEPDIEPSRELPFRRRRSGWPGAGVIALLALLGGAGVFLQRLPGLDQVGSALPAEVSGYLPIVPALGIVLLAAAFVRLRPFVAFAPRRRASVSRLLAASQLERDPEQHSALALVLILAAGIGVFAAIALVNALTSGLPAQPAVRAGAEVGLLAGSLGALVLALAAFAFHFRWAASRRLAEYGGLFAHGLATTQVARSLAAEQGAVTSSSLLAGGLIGIVLALAVLPLPGAPRTAAEEVALGACAFLAALLAATLVVGAVVRRMPARVNPLSDDWRR
jgi:hypothetical protein